MTEPIDTAPDMAQTSNRDKAAARAGNLWTELGPTLAFIIVYNALLRLPLEGLFAKDNALYWATGVLMAGTAIVVTKLLIEGKKIPPLLLISSALIGTFGGLGILLHSKLFLFIKPTIINLIYAGVILGGLLAGRNIWKMLLSDTFDLPDAAWKTLAIRWGLFFIGMAIWNEVLWRNFSEATWANWKIGNLGIVLVFSLLNMPFILKHMRNTEQE